MQENGIGPKRVVVGAGHGWFDWLAQRVTGIIMAVYTLIFLGAFLLASDYTYDGWAGLFANQFIKLLTVLVVLSLGYHAWIGVRDIWMDYIKPVGLRLFLQVLTILWLLATVVYCVQVLWRV